VNKRITILLEGGIGNQLWQVAYAHFLSQNIFSNHTVRVKSRYRNRFALKGLENFCQHIVFQSDSHTIRNEFIQNIFFERVTGLPRIKSALFEEHGENLPSLTSRSKYVIGNFQKITYLQDCSLEFEREVINWLDSTENTNYIPERSGVIHIRRGDYLNPFHMKSIGLLKRDYFLKAFHELNLSVDEIAVITDDMTTQEVENFLGSSPRYFYGKGTRDLDCLKLLSNSSFVVASNSTFSWWGSYLGSKRLDSKTRKVALPFPFFKSLPKEREHLYFPGVVFINSEFEEVN